MAGTQPNNKQDSSSRAQMSDGFVEKIWAQLDQFRKDEAARKDLKRRIRRYEERRRRNERDKRREERPEAQKKNYDDKRGHHRRRTATPHRTVSSCASQFVHSTSGETTRGGDRNAGTGRRHEQNEGRGRRSSPREKRDGERGKRLEDRPQHHRRRSRSPFRSIRRQNRNDRNDRATHSRPPHSKNSDESNCTKKDHRERRERPVRRRRGFEHPPRFTRRRIPPPCLIPLPPLSSENGVSPRKEHDENEDSLNSGVETKPFSFDINMDTRRVRLTYGQALFCELNENEDDPNKYYNLNWM